MSVSKKKKLKELALKRVEDPAIGWKVWNQKQE